MTTIRPEPTSQPSQGPRRSGFQRSASGAARTRHVLFRATTVLLACTVPLLVSATLLAGESAEARTAALLATFERVHSPPDGGTLTPAQQADNRALFAELDAFFDLERFVDATIASSQEAFAADELGRFRGTFASVVRLVAYPDSGAFLRKARRVTTVEPVEGRVHPVRVDLVLPEEDLEVAVTFRWVSRDDGVLVVEDVLFDGESLVLEYQNQFKRIIAKDGVSGLLEKLDKKHLEVQRRQGS